VPRGVLGFECASSRMVGEHVNQEVISTSCQANHPPPEATPLTWILQTKCPQVRERNMYQLVMNPCLPETFAVQGVVKAGWYPHIGYG